MVAKLSRQVIYEIFIFQIYPIALESNIRGRAFVLNNDTFDVPTLVFRNGSDTDVRHLESLLTSLMFEVTVAKNFTAEVS